MARFFWRTFYLINETLPPDRRIRNEASTAIGQYRALLNSTQLLSYTVVAGLMQSALYAYVVGAPFLLMEVYGIRPQYFGIVFFANTAGLIIASQINAAIVERFDSDRILGIALLLPAGLSIILIASLLLGFSSIYVVLAVLFGFLAAHGFVSPNASALGLSKHGTLAGTASAIMGTIQNGLGIATIFIGEPFRGNIGASVGAGDGGLQLPGDSLPSVGRALGAEAILTCRRPMGPAARSPCQT